MALTPTNAKIDVQKESPPTPLAPVPMPKRPHCSDPPTGWPGGGSDPKLQKKREWYFWNQRDEGSRKIYRSFGVQRKKIYQFGPPEIIFGTFGGSS